MEDKLIEILGSFDYPVYRQGSLSQDEAYPDHFFTFWNNDSSDHSHYDNDDYGTAWDFDVNFYGVDPDVVYFVQQEARNKLKQANWIVPGKGYDVASDEITHIGRGMRVFFLEV